jgi:predicted nucleotidyltransferase
MKMAVKPKKQWEHREVTYSSKHWQLLREYREKAKRIMSALVQCHLQALVHGSIARGDVNERSDIDVFIAEPSSSFQVETALARAGIPINARLLVQATPVYTMKAHIVIDEQTSVSFPLMRMRKVEREFYRFGGEITLPQLEANVRVAGVDKRLMLIEPTAQGHLESSIIGREDYTAKILDVSVETVRDRVRALLKRDEVGRTGVFIKREITPEETFEMALRKLADENPAVRRKLKSEA